MALLKTHSWEIAHITTLIGAVAILTVTVHAIGTPRSQTPLSTASLVGRSASAPSVPAQSLTATHPSHAFSRTDTIPAEPSDPHVITVGATGISNRYTLLHIDRKPISPTDDALTIRLHVESLAIENLVSPFESDMLELTAPGQAPIHPMTPFRHPVPGGNSRNQDVVFKVPSTLALSHATLQIHWYNYQNELALSLPPAAGSE